jgi:hypothetical protein
MKRDEKTSPSFAIGGQGTRKTVIGFKMVWKISLETISKMR